jgi:hypothetical protein
MRARFFAMISFMMVILTLTAVGYCADDQFDGKIIYHEEFSDNRNNWDYQDKDTDTKIANGVYVLKNKTDKGFSDTINSVLIDQDQDFQIETSLTKTDGTGNNLYGLIWGYKNLSNFYVFGISASGSYTYLKHVDSKWETVIDWSGSSFIKKGNAGNRLVVSKSGSQLQFFINGHKVDEAPCEKFFGNNVGLYNSSKQTVEVDNLMVTQSTDDAQKEHLVFQEDFINNDNGWFETNNNEVSAKVGRGSYIYEYKDPKGAYFSWHEVDLSEDLDFKIEAIITKISGVDDYAFSVAWGMKDVRNYYTFGINGNGNYLVEKSVDGKWENVVDWNISSYINRKNATNKLAIVKNKDKIEFYINDHKVNEIPYSKFFGDKVGFLIGNKIKIAVDNLIVTQ